MPRAFLLIAACAVSLAVCGADGARAAEASVSITLPAGQSKNVRLRNLPSGAVLMVQVRTSGKLMVALVSASELKSGSAPKPVFRGVIERRMSFKVTVPETSDYYLVLNNSRGTETLDVQTDIRTERGAGRPGPEKPAPSPGREKLRDA